MKIDEDLILRCSSEPGAFRELVERYKRSLYSFLTHMTGPQAADDLFQEVFVRVLRHAGKYEARGKPSSWLFKIANNLALDHLAKERRRRADPLEEELQERRGEPGPLATLEREEVRHRVRSAVARLPADQRQVFLLREYAEMSFKEIADALNVPIGTALSRMNYALKKLRDSLGDLDV